jgi:hypothetical protein
VSDWRTILDTTPECVGVERLGDELTPAEREHVAGCVRCQTELALFRDVTSAEPSADSQWIASELRRRDEKVVPFRPRITRVLYAVAAALAIAIGLGTWMQLREPSLRVPNGTDVYRSARLELVAPAGDLAAPPDALRWKSFAQASRYRVDILEVDGARVWSGETVATAVTLPPDVKARFAPGKTLLWRVEAFRGNESLAVSETQTVRVTP